MSISYTHEQSNLQKDPEATATHHTKETAKKRQEGTMYTPLVTLPPTPTTSYATAKPHHLPLNPVKTCL